MIHKSQQDTVNTEWLHRIGFRKNIRITNCCPKKARVEITSVKKRTLKSSGLQFGGFGGNVEFEDMGKVRSTIEIILPGETSAFSLLSSMIYLTIHIEVGENDWRLFKIDKIVDSSRKDYDILENAAEKCLPLEIAAAKRFPPKSRARRLNQSNAWH